MATTRLGATKQYAENWENIFGGGRAAAGKAKSTGKAMNKKVTKPSATAQPTKKKSTKKKSAAPASKSKAAKKPGGKKSR